MHRDVCILKPHPDSLTSVVTNASSAAQSCFSKFCVVSPFSLNFYHPSSKMTDLTYKLKFFLKGLVAFISVYSIILLLTPLYLFRLLVALASRLLKKTQHGKILDTRSVWFAALEYPRMFKTQSRVGCTVSHLFDGAVTLQQVQTTFQEKLIDLKKPGRDDSTDTRGSLAYPELQQTITSWLGYLFWAWDPQFTIENHVVSYENLSRDSHGFFQVDEQMDSLLQSFSSRPFPEDRSPWQVFIIPNCRVHDKDGVKTLVIFRWHHALADGFSTIKLLVQDLAGYPLEKSIPLLNLIAGKTRENGSRSGIEKIKNMSKKIWLYTRLFFKAPYDLVTAGSLKSDDSFWTMDPQKSTGNSVTALSSLISAEEVKRVKRKYNVPLAAVFFAAFAASLRKFMSRRGMKIPENFYLTTALPMPGHPGTLTNHMAGVTFPLPVSIEDSAGRLNSIKQSFDDLKDSTVPLTFFLTAPFTCSLPVKIVSKCFSFAAGACLMSVFPGPTEQIKVWEKPIEEIYAHSGLVCRNVGLNGGAISYGGGFRLWIGVDEAIIPEKALVQEIVQGLEQEIAEMSGSQVKDKTTEISIKRQESLKG